MTRPDQRPRLRAAQRRAGRRAKPVETPLLSPARHNATPRSHDRRSTHPFARDDRGVLHPFGRTISLCPLGPPHCAGDLRGGRSDDLHHQGRVRGGDGAFRSQPCRNRPGARRQLHGVLLPRLGRADGGAQSRPARRGVGPAGRASENYRGQPVPGLPLRRRGRNPRVLHLHPHGRRDVETARGDAGAGAGCAIGAPLVRPGLHRPLRLGPA